MADGGMPSKKAWSKVTETVKTVLGEPTDATGQFRGLVGMRTVLVSVTGPVSGQQGRYSGKVLVQPNPGTVGNLALSDFGTAKGDATIWYPADIGQSSPTLDYTTTSVYAGLLVGWDKDKAVVVIAGAGGGCTATGAGSNFDVCVGVTWNAGGNLKLQYQKQTLHIDSCGKASMVGSPVSVDVDTGSACS